MEPQPHTYSVEQIEALDAADPLASFRERFVLPDGVTYLDGNSLGALPRVTAERVREVLEAEWGTGLIRSWNSADWINAPRRVGAKIARLIGAGPHEVVVADSTSVNLHKLIVAALSARPGRHTVVSEPGNFPTDLYMVRPRWRRWVVDAVSCSRRGTRSWTGSPTTRRSCC